MFSNYTNAFFRSVVEAVTEFLPVSSTGHLFFFAHFFPFEGLGERGEAFEDLFDIFIQTGAILSVFLLYFSRFWSEASSLWINRSTPSWNRSGWNFYLGLVVGTSPILIFGFAFRKYLDQIKSSDHLLWILASAWLVGGILIWIFESFLTSQQNHQISIDKTSQAPSKGFSFSESLWIGLAQCLALIPGMSRSLASILTARFLGRSSAESAEYSFFLAVPVLTAAGIYKLIKHRELIFTDLGILLLFGSIVSFILCIFVIKLFLGYVRSHGFKIFGTYRILLGLSVFAYLLVQN